jgi:signal transduction histidine kinase
MDASSPAPLSGVTAHPGPQGLQGDGPLRAAAPRQNLFTKYMVATTLVVCLLLAATNGTHLYLSTMRSVAQIEALQRSEASATAVSIGHAIEEIVDEMRWVSLPTAAEGPGELEARRLDFVKLLRQVPAIAEISWYGIDGTQRLRVSRVAIDHMNPGTQARSQPFPFESAVGKPYYGPVHFRGGSEPYMNIAVRLPSGAVVVVELNLNFIGDLVQAVKIGNAGVAFVTDARGMLIAHPDATLVLRRTNLAPTREFTDSLAADGPPKRERGLRHVFVDGLQGQPVLASRAKVDPLGWSVFVELPREEVLAPLYRAIYADLGVLLAALLVSVLAGFLLARRMVRPIRALQVGAAAIGAGQLDHRIDVRTGDEIEALASDFNLMTQRLRDSYATLEQKVAQRTAEVSDQRAVAERADRAKTRFLAAASHDLRQPMHALNLYLGALSMQQLTEPGRRVLVNVRQCAAAMSSLLEALLDISRLDADAMDLKVHDFRLADLLARLEVEFLPQARAKGLRLRVAKSSAWVRSDEAVVERIMRNLVTNAIRHSQSGTVLVGCRHVGQLLRLAVYDQGPGIPDDQRELIFEEFYQLANPERDRTKGLGLGLSIVKRLASLLDASVALKSVVGRGTMFGLDLARAAPPTGNARSANRAEPEPTSIRDALVVVVDDDGMVLKATRELLVQWGCHVLACTSAPEALAALASCPQPPNLLICDYRLPGADDGMAVVEKIREEFNLPIPALIVTGDVLPEQLDQLQALDVTVLHKPVSDGMLRQCVERMLGA